ncbi:MAG TPA: hypothetical protein VGI39_31560 [Polyangiaceae bacterium]
MSQWEPCPRSSKKEPQRARAALTLASVISRSARASLGEKSVKAELFDAATTVAWSPTASRLG